MLSFRSSKQSIFILAASAVAFAACGGGSGGGSTGTGGGGGGAATVWLIPVGEVQDGGPGQDGIPPIDNPKFIDASMAADVEPDDMVIAVRYAGQVKIYPHDIMDYHEIVNDGIAANPLILSYCPLTDSAVAWQGNPDDADRTFGTSGLLYDSNLILYDRETRTLWSQMLQLGVNGPRVRETPENFQIIEATFTTLLAMYPDAVVMTRNTGHARDYDRYPYGTYLTSSDLLFPVSHLDDRLFPKDRVVGIYDDNNSKAYQIAGFGSSIQTINDQFQDQSIVVVGNSDMKFGVIFSRRLADGTILNFSPIQDDLPNVMSDDEGNVWDAFGTAVSGPRAGEQLRITRSYKAMWFAWGAFHRDSEIHFN